MNDMETNENLTLKQFSEYWDEAKTKLWRQYHLDQFGREQGEYKFWFEDGQISSIRNCKDMELHGKNQKWWSNGTRFFVDTNHFKKGMHGTKIEFKYKLI